jgi:predicted amidohydrolase
MRLCSKKSEGRKAMKSFLHRTLVALLACALVAVAAFAGGKAKIRKETVTFASDVTVNGTLLKAGNYDLRFNEETGELAIMKGGKVKVTTTGHLEPRSDKARDTLVRTRTKDNVVELIGVTFGGSNQNLVVGTSSGAVTGNK